MGATVIMLLVVEQVPIMTVITVEAVVIQITEVPIIGTVGHHHPGNYLNFQE